MKSLVLLSPFLLAGCSQHFACRRDAYAAHSHVNAGQGVLGSLIVSAVTPKQPPAPPLDEMLAACK
jgi:hypothetical protein